jgi:hypothetical protein
MTPHFTLYCWDYFPRSGFLPFGALTKIFFFTDFDSDLRKMRAFSREVCSLEVALKLKDLQFTFTALLWLGKAPQDTYDSDF